MLLLFYVMLYYVIDILCYCYTMLWVLMCPVLNVSYPVCWSIMLECGMLERDRRALRRRSAVLCKQLVVDELFIQSLQADDILTESMAESIMVCKYGYMEDFLGNKKSYCQQISIPGDSTGVHVSVTCTLNVTCLNGLAAK